jgi:hypothetical protein
LKMSPTSLYRAVALYDLCSRLSTELWRDFGAGHLRAVLGLQEELQVKLLSRAKVEDWTARELAEHAAIARGRARTRVADADGSAPLVRELERLLSRLEQSRGRLATIPDRDIRDLLLRLRHTLDAIERDTIRAIPEGRANEVVTTVDVVIDGRAGARRAHPIS